MGRKPGVGFDRVFRLATALPNSSLYFYEGPTATTLVGGTGGKRRGAERGHRQLFRQLAEKGTGATGERRRTGVIMINVE